MLYIVWYNTRYIIDVSIILLFQYEILVIMVLKTAPFCYFFDLLLFSFNRSSTFHSSEKVRHSPLFFVSKSV